MVIGCLHVFYLCVHIFFVFFFSEKYVRFLQWKNLELNLHVSVTVFDMVFWFFFYA